MQMAPVVSEKVHLTKLGQPCQSRPIFQNISTTGSDLFHFSFHFHFCPKMHKKNIAINLIGECG